MQLRLGWTPLKKALPEGHAETKSPIPASKGVAPYADKAAVLNSILHAQTQTLKRLNALRADDTATDMRSFQILKPRLNAINDLHARIARDELNWERFGGFTGWDQMNLACNWVPPGAGFGQFQGWIDYQKTDHQEVSLAAACEGDLAPKSVTQALQSSHKKGWVSRISHFFKSTDGWDELGSGIGQTLPGIGQHLATTVILSVLAPFVYLGVKGMQAEMQEKAMELKQIIDAENESRVKVTQLLALAESLVGNMPAHTAFSDEALMSLSEDTFNEIAYARAKTIQLTSDKMAANIAYEATPFGLAAMSGMFGGMVTGTIAAGVEVADAATKSTVSALGTLADVFSALTAGLFIPAQLAMIVYGGKKAKEGELLCQTLDRQAQAVKALETAYIHRHPNRQHRESRLESPIQTEFFDAAIDNLNRLKQYHHQGKVVYGRGIQVSEGGMVAGGVMSLTGLGIPAIATLIPSAISTIAFAGHRIMQEYKLEKFLGKIHHENITNPLLDAGPQQKKSGVFDHIEKQSGRYWHITEALADAKINSLVLRALSRKRWFARLFKWLPRMIASGRWSVWRRSSLASDVIRHMKTRFRRDEVLIDILKPKSQNASDVLVKMARRIMQNPEHMPDAAAALLVVVRDLAAHGQLDRLKQQKIQISVPQRANHAIAGFNQKKADAADLLKVLLSPDENAMRGIKPQELSQWRDALLLNALRLKVKVDKNAYKAERQKIFSGIYLNALSHKLRPKMRANGVLNHHSEASARSGIMV